MSVTRYFFALALLGGGLVQNVNAEAREKIFCEGDYSGCSVRAKNVVPCGTGAGNVAKEFCTVHTADGEKVGEYYLETVSTDGGGQCGYTVFKVQCK